MAAAVAAVVVTVVVVVVLAVAPHALDFAVAAALVVKKEHMTSPPLSYVNEWAEVDYIIVLCGTGEESDKNLKTTYTAQI